MRCSDVATLIEELAPPRGNDEGFRFGDPGAEVRKIMVAWMATLEVIGAAAQADCNLLIVHEELHFPYSHISPGLENFLCWPVNRARIEALAKAEITVYRAHGMLDRFCILDDFGKALNLPEPTVAEGYFRIYDVQPTPVVQVAERAKQRLKLPHLRVTGALDNMVRRIGLAWGGLGLSLNVGFLNDILRYQPDCLIAGETDEYAQRFCQDAGVVLIETGHAASEEPGLKHFAEWLAKNIEPVPVLFHRLCSAWVVV
ncbi:MAG: Nif3-like dinuclear metal center hexameric protein [Armatimonadetes bacterium]|nr:Nif3-like dinuclear metal center hexameric protein [Armatimonadota bacterium]